MCQQTQLCDGYTVMDESSLRNASYWLCGGFDCWMEMIERERKKQERLTDVSPR